MFTVKSPYYSLGLFKRNATLLSTRLNNTSERASKRRSQPCNLCWSQELRVARASRDNLVRLSREESTGGFHATWIRYIKTSDENSWLALRVEPPVNQTLREEHAREVAQCRVDLGQSANDWWWCTDDVAGTIIVLEDQGSSSVPEATILLHHSSTKRCERHQIPIVSNFKRVWHC
ncbi:hypothetical protein BDV96DRAFT_603167 [Lophiotrema nucula]|uniref:Uncharacterized protein n=1 Tax=Lophiotrema nucula TaxID=690887 RepID=A0A6A5YXM3_9PLEO|nr:hypothetical protein BDV96DRAFT_603167 [Lophiotrema nucula]